MYNIDMNPATAAAGAGDEDLGSGGYATGPGTSSSVHNTVYAVPMEADLAADGGYLGINGVDGSTATSAAAAGVESGTVMYVSAVNQNSPEYATAAANDALYSVVSRPGRGGGGGGGGDGKQRYGGNAPPQGLHEQSTVYATAADDQSVGGNAANYDVAVHQGGGGGSAMIAEYSHLAPRIDGVAGQQQQQGSSNNHYDAGNPRRAVVVQSTVYATVADDQSVGGNAANYDVAVHQGGGGPARTTEYSHLALRNDAGGQQQGSNNHYDAGNPRALRASKVVGHNKIEQGSSSSNNHYDAGNPRLQKDADAVVDGADSSTLA